LLFSFSVVATGSLGKPAGNRATGGLGSSTTLRHAGRSGQTAHR
jgi:hypothetical protein